MTCPSAAARCVCLPEVVPEVPVCEPGAAVLPELPPEPQSLAMLELPLVAPLLEPLLGLSEVVLPGPQSALVLLEVPLILLLGPQK